MAEMVSPGDSNSIPAGFQSSDYYRRQEEAILSRVTQSHCNAAEMVSPGSSNSRPGGMQSSDYYQRQEEAILSRVTQSNWNAAEMAAPGGFIPLTQASH
jgi:hypothetical protein